MKLKSNNIKWLSMLVIVSLFFNFIVTIPSVYAQEEVPATDTVTPTLTPTLETENPISSATPTPTPIEESFYQTIVPTPMVEEPLPSLQQFEGESILPSQSNQQSVSSSFQAIWPAFNISDTDFISKDASLAVDFAGNIHFTWVENDNAGAPEVFYSFWDFQNKRLSQPFNVSQSPSFSSQSSQIAVDSSGKAHIVWEEQDDDYASDAEIMYSKCEMVGDTETGFTADCVSPSNLSSINNWDCGIYAPHNGDWLSLEPIISVSKSDNINEPDRVMVLWEAFEPGQVTQPYSTWLASGTPPSRPTGCVPLAGSGLFDHEVRAHNVTSGGQNNFQVVFMEKRANGTFEIYGSEYLGSAWSSPTLLGQGLEPDLFLDTNGTTHVTWCTVNGQIKYWNSTSQSLEDILPGNSFSLCSGDVPIVVDQNGISYVFWQSPLGKIYMSKRDSSVWSEPVLVNEGNGSQASPDAFVSNDVNNNETIHVVWQDLRDGSGVPEIYYSYSYSCEGIEPTTDAGKAVLESLKDSGTQSLNYCKNDVGNIIRVSPESNIPSAAFNQWGELIASAQNEIAFTTMLWDDGIGSTSIVQDIYDLYTKVENPNNANLYPRGMTVRILLGVQTENSGGIDQRHIVLADLKEEDVPIYDILSDGRIWKVEVALYKNGTGAAKATGKIHSHVKLMVIDNKEIIISGYNLQNGVYNNQTTDAGLRVSGPIAANGMLVFDSLWEGSEVLCTEANEDNFFQIPVEDCATKSGTNPAHWIFTPINNGDIVLPLYRDNHDKTADRAVEAAFTSMNNKNSTQIYALQNRFAILNNSYPNPGEIPQLYDESGPLSYQEPILKEAIEGTDIRILVEGYEGAGSLDLNSSYYNTVSMKNFIDIFYSDGGSNQKEIKDFIRFFPDGGLHAKTFLIDNEFLVVGSQNFDHSAFGNVNIFLDLVEYSLGIEDDTPLINNDTAVDDFKIVFNLDSVWEEAGKALTNNINQSIAATLQQANAGDVVILEEGEHEISSPLTIPEGVVLFGYNATLKPSATFTGGALLRLTNNNVLINGVIIQDSPNYGIEIGDGTTAPENVNISGVVFVNNALGGIHIQSPAGGNPVNYTIENNTFIGDDYGITISANANTTGVIRNNIFAGQEIVPIQITSADDGTTEYSYNLFYDCNNGSCASNNWKSGNLGANSSEHDNLFDLDPLFVSPATGDYQLSYSSPAIDAGDPSLLHEFLFDGDGDGIPYADMGAFEYYDLTAPAVQSVTRASIDPSSASSIDFTVTFSEPVTGVDVSDFTLNTTGVTGTFITNVSGSGAIYTVTVNTGSDNGTIRLDVVDDDTILDNLSNPLSSGFVNGETYTINKDTWNTFLGGTGNDRSYAVVRDISGNFYVSGISSEGWGNPIRAYTGSDDAFVAKVDSSGNLMWNTFLGGANSEGYGYEFALDENGNMYIIGSSDSNWGSPIQAYTDLRDGFVAKLSPSGDLLWNTFIGGSTSYDTALGIKVRNGIVYVVGNSNAGFGNPINAYTAGNESYLANLNADTGSLNWHTFFGGNGEDLPFKVYLSNSSSNIYVAGYGNGTWGNPVQPHSAGTNNDGYVAKFNTAGTLLWSTFFGADGYDIVYAIDENSTGDLYLAGRSSATWGDPLNIYAGGSIDAFVAELNPNTGVLLWHRFVGGSGADFAWSLEVDSQDNINITGSSDATWGSPVRTHAGDYEGFYAKLSPTGGLLVNSFVGGSGADRGYGIVLDTNNDMYLAGYSTATWDNPIRAYTNSNDAYLTKINISNLPLIVSSVIRNNASPTNSSTISFTITFSEPVTGVDLNDFNLNTTGITGASISNVTGTDATYTVNVNTGSGDGTIRLDVVNNGTILDNESNSLTNDFVTGQPYTIDRNAPTVLSINKAIANPNLSGLNFTVTFSEPVTDVDVSDFGLTTTGVTGTSISSVSGSGNTYTVNVNSGVGSGTVKLNIVDNDTILDAASNPLGGVGAGNGSYTAGQSFTVTSVTLNSLATQDGHILESTENSGIGGTVNSTSTSFVVGDDATDKQYISVMHFNTSTLPDTVSIASATVKVKQQGTVTGTNPFTTHGTLMVDMQNPYFGTSNSLVVADFQATAGQSNVATFDSTPVSSWYSALINSTGYVQLNLTSTTQIRIRFSLDDNDDTGADYIAFSSGNNTTVANRPQLVIQYYTP